MKVTTIEHSSQEVGIATQEEVDAVFETMVARMSDLCALEREIEAHPAAFSSGDRKLELESIRDGILGELLEQDPHESIAEVVHSLALVYEGRTIETQLEDATVLSFATREGSRDDQLNSVFDVFVREEGVDVYTEFAREGGMSYGIRTEGDRVGAYVNVGTYEIPTDPYAVGANGGPNKYQEILRDFYLHALTTAGIAISRRQQDVAGADQADASAYAMLLRERAAL